MQINKEQYYTGNSIEQQARDFLKKIMPLRIKHENSRINPAKVALLIIDMQNFFVDRLSHAYIPSVQAIIPRIVKLQEYCFAKQILVIHTQHGNTQKTAGMMAKWWGDHLLDVNDPTFNITSEIASIKAHLIVKTQYDAFYNSNLEEVLQANGIEQLIIAGVMAHLCCETTARVAFTRGYEVFFGVDVTATYNHSFHLSTLINLAHGFSVPLLLDEVIDQLERKK